MVECLFETDMPFTDTAPLIHERAAQNALEVQIPRPALKLEPHVRNFSQTLEQSLNAAELQTVQSFFVNPTYSRSSVSDSRRLTEDIEVIDQAFCEQEVKLSNQDPRGLTLHSGPLTAIIGVVLHVDHYNAAKGSATEAPRPFWSPYSDSNQVLTEKGFDETFTFGMDWHHRATRRNMGCPVKAWGPDVQACHDKLSSDLLGLIPCPYLVVGGFCAWRGYTEAIKHRSRIISTFAHENTELTYALEFEDFTQKNFDASLSKSTIQLTGFITPSKLTQPHYVSMSNADSCCTSVAIISMQIHTK